MQPAASHPPGCVAGPFRDPSATVVASRGQGEERCERRVSTSAFAPRHLGPSDDDDLRFELTKRDQDFLKSLSIRPETG